LKETNINCFDPISFVQVFAKIACVANIQNNVHPLFIHKYHSSMDTWQNILPHQQKFYFIVKEHFPNIMSTWIEYSKKDLVMVMHSCLPPHVHARRLVD
jgi:hypothetical protein